MPDNDHLTSYAVNTLINGLITSHVQNFSHKKHVVRPGSTDSRQRGSRVSDNISGQDSRQGKRGRPALYVLIVSVGLMLTSLAGLMIWQGATAPPDYASRSQAASRK